MNYLTPKAKQFAIDFARFCIDSKLYPKQAMHICELAQQLFDACVKQTSIDNFDIERYFDAFEDACKEYDIEYDTSSPWPYLKTEAYPYLTIPSMEI